VASRVGAERIRQSAPERSRSQDPENAIANTTVFKETRSFAETVFGSTGWPSDFISNVESRNHRFAAHGRRTTLTRVGQHEKYLK